MKFRSKTQFSTPPPFPLFFSIRFFSGRQKGVRPEPSLWKPWVPHHSGPPQILRWTVGPLPMLPENKGEKKNFGRSQWKTTIKNKNFQESLLSYLDFLSYTITGAPLPEPEVWHHCAWRWSKTSGLSHLAMWWHEVRKGSQIHLYSPASGLLGSLLQKQMWATTRNLSVLLYWLIILDLVEFW